MFGVEFIVFERINYTIVRIFFKKKKKIRENVRGTTFSGENNIFTGN